MIQGESYSIGVLFPDFDINRIIRFKIAIGKTVVGTYPDGNAIQITDGFRVALTGDETKLLQGGNSNIQVYITDSQLGVLKPFVTTLKVENTNIQDAGSEANSGYNFILTVKIKETTVSYSYQFKDLIKGEQGIQGIQGVQGDKGDAGTIEVGTVTTGDAGTDVVVENVGTPSEAVLNFTIPKGSSGDFFSGDYNLIINKQDAKWVDGWLHIDTGAKTRDKIIQVGYLSINTGIGTEQLKPIVHYPAGLTYQFSSIPNGFYLKDVDGRLSENTDFEFLDVRYNILSDTTYKYDGLTQLPKAGFILDEVNGEEYHSKYGIYAFNAVYPEYTGVQVQSVLDALTNFSGVDSFYTPTYARLKGCNLISRPYQNAAINENLGSNPDILTIAAHYGNTFERRDITANATTFIQNVIAVGSCGDGEPDPLTWTSYGYGMEFSERGNNLGLNADYPDVTFDHVIGYGTGIGNTFTDSVGTKNYSNILELSVGTIIKIGLTLETAIEYTIASLGSTTFTTVETINLQEGTNYVWITAHIGTAWQAVADNQKYYQSPVTSIIAAKFRKIQDATQASWDICRMAARATASNGGTWDMYRGFGVIDVDAAIQYIKDNYTENADYLSALADDVERTRGIDPMLPFENISENTPVPKGKMHEVTENNYTDDDKAKVTELSPLFWDEDNNTFSFLVPDGGSIQIGQEPHDYYTNLQGAQIVNGDIVSVVGATGNRTAIALTDATNDAKALACFGMVTVATIGNNNVGRITKSGGKVRGVNTSGYAEGATIYVDPLNPGKWTGVKPSAPLRAIQIGVVSVSHAVNGVVELFIKVYPRFGELADVDGTTTEVLDAETMPVKKADGLVKFLSWSNIKARLKTYFDGLYATKSTAMYKLVNDNNSYSHTGSTSLITVKTITVPAGSMTNDGVIWFNILSSWTNSQTNKTFRILINDVLVFASFRTISSMVQHYFPLRFKDGKLMLAGTSFDNAQTLFGVNSNSTTIVETNVGNITAEFTIKFQILLTDISDKAAFEAINIIIEK